MTTWLETLDRILMPGAQHAVTQHHYLHRPVDPRCSAEGYAVHVNDVPGPVGYLLFGRPEATRVNGWYGGVMDVHNGACECTRWQVLNLARVWLSPKVQPGGCHHNSLSLPGFTDRKGTWRSTLATTAIRMALARIGFDYLIRRPVVWPEEPYQIDWVLSYCDPRLHKGTIYRAAGFELYRVNDEGLQTWRIRLPALSAAQRDIILARSEQDQRAKRYRAARAAAGTATQPALL